METQLLCTFCSVESLNETLYKIQDCYDIAFDTIYILENIDSAASLCCTYNVIEVLGKDIPDATISLHRKKHTNTLYTINALNMLVQELNNGILSKQFIIPWEEYRNTILVTAYGKLKKIRTKLKTVHRLSGALE